MCPPESGKEWDALLGEELEGAFVFNWVRKPVMS